MRFLHSLSERIEVLKESFLNKYASLAQLVEQLTCNQ